MKEVILYADATFGLKVNAGDSVEEGDELGIAVETGKVLFSPVTGIVEKIFFNSEQHTFFITLLRQ